MMMLLPHMLVRVTEATYTYIAEVISYPYRKDPLVTEPLVVNVRIPEDPTTMHPVPTTAIQGEWRSRHLYVHYARVKPMRGNPARALQSFPIDMLRYEAAAPASFRLVDSNTGRWIVEQGPEEEALGLIIAHVSDSPLPRWTPRRWESFDWQLETLRTRNIL